MGALDQRFSTLIVSDSEERSKELLKAVKALGLTGMSCAGSSSHLEKMLAESLSVVIIDASTGQSHINELTANISATLPDVQIIQLLSAKSASNSAVAGDTHNVWRILSPYEEESLYTLITKACIMFELNQTQRELKEASSSVVCSQAYIAESNVMKTVEKSIKKVAGLDSSLLLTGESGTGKTFLAHQVHDYSPRKHKPFVTLSCAAIPRDLLEAELFGHTKGSFTGAHSDRPGSLELADGGTLFLDELGEMPLELQPKLLNVLQDMRYRRVGGDKEKSVDVRVIAATNRNLEEMCAQGLFREDLYYRINVLNIKVPPLRDRTDDILPMAELFIDKIVNKRKVHKIELSKRAQAILMSYSWPGNVRELENTLERATAFCENNTISENDLDFLSNQKATSSTSFSLAGLTLEEIEQKALLDTLEHTKGNKAEAAQLLGISLKSVYNKLQKFQPES